MCLISNIKGENLCFRNFMLIGTYTVDAFLIILPLVRTPAIEDIEALKRRKMGRFNVDAIDILRFTLRGSGSSCSMT